MAGFVLMLPLAVTSNNFALRRMGGKAWRRLHWLTYPAGVLGAVHFVLLRKGWQLEPLIYLAIIVGLLLIRLVWVLGRVTRGRAVQLRA
jgi:sulfoxide reductase heme-binding subunit YedZ